MRDSHPIACIPAQRTISPGIVVGLFSIMLVVWPAVVCQSTYSQTAEAREKPMKHYAMIFYAPWESTSIREPSLRR
jgi:hypothetical protein